MFTGIVESLGTVKDIIAKGTNLTFQLESSLAPELKVDQSVSHNGVCLTVEEIVNDGYTVTAIEETLQKSNLGTVRPGGLINLERAMLLNSRLDGHIVQGHVDQVGTVTRIEDMNGSWLFDFEYDDSYGHVTIEKGSICVNGVSLTCFNSQKKSFSVAIIPYTYNHTNFRLLKEGDLVNLEFDVLGKYVKRLLKY